MKKSQTVSQKVVQMKKDLGELFLKNPELKTSFHIERFLRARDYNYEKAKKMMENYLTKRMSKNINKITQIDFNSPKIRLMKKLYPSGEYGHDKEGRVLSIQFFGRFMLDEIFANFSEQEIEDYVFQNLEYILFVQFPILSQKFGKRIDRIFSILDCRDVSVMKLMSSKSRTFLQILSKTMQDNYPEMLGKSIVINAPFGFEVVYKFIGLFLDKKTMEKFEVYSSPAEKRMNELFDQNMLPIELGGTNPVAFGDYFGINMEAVKDANQRRSLFLKDRTPEYQYFYTEEERKEISENRGHENDGVLIPEPKFYSIENVESPNYISDLSNYHKVKSCSVSNITEEIDIRKSNTFRSKFTRIDVRTVRYFEISPTTLKMKGGEKNW